MTRAQAVSATGGGLCRASKMPCKTYSTAPWLTCRVGKTMRKHKRSVCAHCYAYRGKAHCPDVTKGWEARATSLTNSDWVDGMVWLITHQQNAYFRWHTAGDLISLDHTLKIFDVCNQTPTIAHWLPTHDPILVLQALRRQPLPINLCVRIASPLIGQAPLSGLPQELSTCTVSANTGHLCEATRTRKVCGECRACWSPAIPNVDYRLH